MIATVLDLDLVGYSTITAAVEAAGGSGAVAGVNREILDLVTAGLQAAGGSVEANLIQGTGDGALLRFARPDAAVRCAAAIFAAADAINRNAPGPMRQRWFRMGIATGELAREEYADGQSTWGGTVIATAVRLEAAAKPGALMVLDATWQALDPELKAGFGEPAEVRGKRSEQYAARSRRFQEGDPPPELTGRRQDPELLQELVSLLEGVSLPSDLVTRLYHQACSPLWPRLGQSRLPEYARNLWDALGEPRPLLRFVGLLAAHVEPVVRGELCDWNERALAHFLPGSESCDTGRVGLADLSPSPQKQSTNTFLLVKLDPEGRDWRVRIWLRMDDEWREGCPHDNRLLQAADTDALSAHLRRVVTEAVTWSEDLGAQAAELYVEVVLPVALLPLDIDQWERADTMLPDDRVGWRFPVVVRPRERAVNRARRQEVKDRWQRAVHPESVSRVIPTLAGGPLPGGVAVAWVCPEVPLPTLTDVKNCSALAAAALDGQPKPDLARATHRGLCTLLQAGVPAILWTRHQPTPGCQGVSDLLLGSLHELPERVLQFRRQGEVDPENADHAAHHVTLVWDHPEHWPPDDSPGTRAAAA